MRRAPSPPRRPEAEHASVGGAGHRGIGSGEPERPPVERGALVGAPAADREQLLPGAHQQDVDIVNGDAHPLRSTRSSKATVLVQPSSVIATRSDT